MSTNNFNKNTSKNNLKYKDNSFDDEPKHVFTGYWIPKELSKLGLTPIEQFLLSMIDSLEADAPEYCFASNSYLAKKMNLSESRISYYITKFKRLELIEEVEFNGRRRRLRVLKHNWYREKVDKKKLELKNSKKELCVSSRTLPTRVHVVCLRESTQHIINTDNKSIKKEQQQEASPKQDAAVSFSKKKINKKPQKEIYQCLHSIALTKEEMQSITNNHDEIDVIKAINVISSKKSSIDNLMGYLLFLLKNKIEPPKSQEQLINENKKYANDVEKTHTCPDGIQLHVLSKHVEITFNNSQKIPDCLDYKSSNFQQSLNEKLERYKFKKNENN